MTSHAPYAKEVKRVVAMLGDDTYADAESMAADILGAAFEMFCANHGKFTVVGQCRYPKAEAGTKVVLGWFSSRGKAESAGHSLAYSASSGEEYDWVVLPVHQGTPAEYHTARKKARGDDESEGRLPWVEEWEKARAA